jgi:hypothetical protein
VPELDAEPTWNAVDGRRAVSVNGVTDRQLLAPEATGLSTLCGFDGGETDRCDR